MKYNTFGNKYRKTSLVRPRWCGLEEIVEIKRENVHQFQEMKGFVRVWNGCEKLIERHKHFNKHIRLLNTNLPNTYTSAG